MNGEGHDSENHRQGHETADERWRQPEVGEPAAHLRIIEHQQQILELRLCR